MTADTPTRPTPAEAIAWGDRIMSLPGSDHDASPLSVLVDLARDGQRLREALPKDAFGTPLVPGMAVTREYVGSTWRAEIVGVSRVSIDIQYTNDASHGARHAIRRLADPGEWLAEPVTPSAETNDG